LSTRDSLPFWRAVICWANRSPCRGQLCGEKRATRPSQVVGSDAYRLKDACRCADQKNEIVGDKNAEDASGREAEFVTLQHHH